ncbi:hypothetical protein C8Q78DRAFT_545821 [Trametes maxima]|nr:hypothetical protein C8Q78DRAFT_545821 [Trametes maxima]
MCYDSNVMNYFAGVKLSSVRALDGGQSGKGGFSTPVPPPLCARTHVRTTPGRLLASTLLRKLAISVSRRPRASRLASVLTPPLDARSATHHRASTLTA